jgi:glycosyltransferase involved in cell wall biosynthesis
MKSVLIIEAQMKQYRLPFYERLYERLQDEAIRLTVAYSDPAFEEMEMRDNRHLPSEYGLNVKGSWLLKRRILYQPLFREISSADLVISDHAYRMALTHYLLMLSRLGLKRVAFWGHGKNRRGSGFGFFERCKQRTLNWVTWWFAYTAGTADYLQGQGVPKSKITAVQNSVDTRRIQEYVRSLDPDAKAKVRAKLGIPSNASVGIFVGALQKVKSVPLLLEASLAIRKRVDEFHLIIVGGGPEEEVIRESVRGHAWVHFLGPRFGDEKSELLAIADAFLMPGSVGLAILDAFAAGLPLVTTQLSTHCPELEYLEESRNGLMTAHHPERYAEAVAQLFTDRAKMGALREGARRSAEKYSIENMVENFTDGIVRCLGQTNGQSGGAEMHAPHGDLQQAGKRETWRSRVTTGRSKPDAAAVSDALGRR